MLVDLHVHLRGTLTPGTVLSLAQRNGTALPEAVLAAPRYGWHDFPSFLAAYDLITSVVRSAKDLEEVALVYLETCAAAGGAYVEVMLSPPDLARTGVPFSDQIRALEAAAQQAAEEWDIHCRLIATAVRHLGPNAAVQAARMAVSIKSDLLVGFGLTGDETRHSAREFAEAFSIARSEGLRATAHAGEHLTADTILEAVESLRLDRVGHGVRAAESPDVLRELAAARIPLEVCLTSNIALGLYASIEAHPIGQLAAGGCTIVLGTDDPGFFDTDLAGEYDLAVRSTSSLSHESISAAAIDAAFCDAETKGLLASRLRDTGARAECKHHERQL